MEQPKRKTIRLKGYNYNTPGYYFLTICTKDKKNLLCDIVGTGVPDGPQVLLTQYGQIAEKQLHKMSNFYEDIKIEKYVVMPNHVHLLIHLLDHGNGPSGRPVPTNSRIAGFVGTFKRFCSKSCGQNIWQPRSYDHIIRDQHDYDKIWTYIDNNPAKWAEDSLFSPHVGTGVSDGPNSTIPMP